MLLFLIILFILYINITLSASSIGWLNYKTNLTATIDSSILNINNKLYLYGGYNDYYDAYSNDWYQYQNLLKFDIDLYSNYSIYVSTQHITNFNSSSFNNINIPILRTAQSSIYNNITNEIIVFGGHSEKLSSSRNDLWAFNLTSNSWRLLQDVSNSTNQPLGRSWASFTKFIKNGYSYALLDGGAIFNAGDLHDTWILNITSLSDITELVQWIDITNITTSLYGGEGARMVVDSNNQYLYRFGGYNCTINSVSINGGDNCYSNDLFRISIADYSIIKLPSTTYSPSRRAYHASIFYNDRIYVIGGAYFNLLGVWSFYNDVYIYDISNSVWSSISVFGTPMAKAWSFSAALIGNSIFIFGGGSEFNFYNTIFILYLDVNAITENNFYVSDSSFIFPIAAGSSSSFNVQVRNYTFAASSMIWGDVLPWATALDFSVVFIGRSNLDGNNVVIQYSKKDSSNFIDNLDGTYTIYYTITSGSNFKVYITYLNAQSIRANIPGSPYQLIINPSRISPRLCTATQEDSLQGSLSTMNVKLYDQYLNPVNATLDYLPLLKIYVNNVLVSNTIVELFTSDSNIGINLSYYTPLLSTYAVVVNFNGTSVLNSPLKITAYLSPEVSSTVSFGFSAVTIFCLTLAGICLIVLLIFWYLTNPVIKASSPPMMLAALLGIFFATAGVNRRLYPKLMSNIDCFLSSWFIGIGFCICCSTILLKSYRINKIFNSKNLLNLKISDLELLGISFCLVLIESFLQVMTLYFDTPSIQIYSLPSNPLLTYHLCRPASLSFQIPLYAYKLYGCYIAFLTRNTPAIYNESIILFSVMLNILFTSCIVLPLAMFLQTENPTSVYILELNGVLWCCLFLLCAIYISKFIHLFDPIQKNVVQNIGLKHLSSANDLIADSKANAIEKEILDLFEKCELERISNETKLQLIEVKQVYLNKLKEEYDELDSYTTRLYGRDADIVKY